MLVAACGDDAVPGVRVATLAELDGHQPIDFELDDGLQAFVVKLHRPAVGGIGPEESIVAFSRLCPHMGCPMAGDDVVDAERGRFGPCRCHQSVFDLTRDGRMLHGRASSNLTRIELTLAGGEIHAGAPVRLPFGRPLTAATALSSSEEDAETR